MLHHNHEQDNKADQPVNHGEHGTHDKHEGHSPEAFLKKFWISLALTIPILAYSDLPEAFFGISAPAFGIAYFQSAISFFFGSIVFFYGGWVFLSGAKRELEHRLPGMMTLIALAIMAAFLYSTYAVFSELETLYWELATLITIMLLGHWLEMRSVQGAKSALRELAKLLPDRAEVVRGRTTEFVPLESLKISDAVIVRPGGKIPADGKILEGSSGIDESIVTGESRPVDKKEGDEIIAGTINSDGALKIEVTKTGEKTFLAGIMRLVSEAESSKSRLQLLSDRAAFYLTILAISAGSITFLAWFSAGAGISFAITRLVAVLVVACPHALGLAIPLVASISAHMAASSGFLIRRRQALEAARQIDVVLFDKTGTLTKGEFGVQAIIPAEGFTESRLLELAASVNSRSEHAIAKAIANEARRRKINFVEAKDFQRLPGKGAKGKTNGKEIVVGNETLMRELGMKPGEKVSLRTAQLAAEGKTVIYCAEDRAFAGAVALADMLRDESREAVKRLKEMNIRVAMITGDAEEVAAWAARQLEIEEYFAKVLPQEKSEKVKLLQNRGYKVAMVGDGINDAPALTQADLGIAIGAGTNIAIESAGIILVKNDPRDVPKILRLASFTYSKMLQNLFWATGYNIIALPLAAGVLAHQGIILHPAAAAVLMSASTVVVAANAILLKRKKL